MSNSPNNGPMKTFVLPLLGATGLIIGGGYALSKTSYGDRQIEILEEHVDKVSAQAEQAKSLLSAEAEKAAAARELAESEAARAAELETQIAAIQERALAGGGKNIESASAPASNGKLGIGHTALAAEIAAWDVDVLPDGRGLPEGSGNVEVGEEVFADKCASCHGDFAEGADNWPVLAGGFNTLADADPVKTVGSYWPYLSTTWDYINRSMPFGDAGTLTADETYAIVAYILYSNDLVDDDFVLSRDNFSDFEMPNKDGFVVDDRPALEYAKWTAEPCMENCKDEVKVSMRSVFLVDTPPEGGTESVMNPGKVEGLPTFSASGPSFIPVAEPKVDQVAVATPVAEETPKVQETEEGDGNAELIASGEKVFRKCKACHAVGDRAKNKSGPQLNNLIGRTMGSVDGFKYSAGFKSAAEEGRVWDEAGLAEFLAKPKAYMKGTKMAFGGLKKEADLKAVTAYLNSFGE